MPLRVLSPFSMPQFKKLQNVGLPFRRQVSESREQSYFGGIFVTVNESYRTREQFIDWNVQTIGQSFEPVSRWPKLWIILNTVDVRARYGFPETEASPGDIRAGQVLLCADATNEISESLFHGYSLSSIAAISLASAARKRVKILISKSIFASETRRARLVPRKNSS